MAKDVKGQSASKRGLTDKQKRFVDEYLIDLNATQAAIRAGYSEETAAVIGCENLIKPNIQKEIAKRQNHRSERTELSQDEVINDLRELRDICMGRKKITVSEVIKDNQKLTALSADVEVTIFEPVAANKALDLLGKHLGIFKDKVDVSSSDGSLNPTVIKLVAPQLGQTDE